MLYHFFDTFAVVNDYFRHGCNEFDRFLLKPAERKRSVLAVVVD